MLAACAPRYSAMVRLSSFRILIERAMYHPAVTIPLSRLNGAEMKIEEMEGDGSRARFAACHVNAIMRYKCVANRASTK